MWHAVISSGGGFGPVVDGFGLCNWMLSPPSSALSRFKTGSIGATRFARSRGRQSRLDLSLAQVIACLPTAGISDLLVGQARPRRRVVGFVQLHVPAPQEARRNNHGMGTSVWGTDTGKFYSESVHVDLWLPAVERQSSSVLLTVACLIALAN